MTTTLAMKSILNEQDPTLSAWLNADETTARGDHCPGCGAAWHIPVRTRRWELRHDLECPFRDGWVQANLGRICGQLLYAMNAYDRFCDDPITRHYGVADEFCSLVERQVANDVRVILARTGLSAEGLLWMVDERCGPRFTHFSGLNHITEYEEER